MPLAGETGFEVRVDGFRVGQIALGGLLSIAFSDPPSQSQCQEIVDKLNELITALRR